MGKSANNASNKARVKKEAALQQAEARNERALARSYISPSSIK
jgi:hypothetical protein